tara:strand:- start:1189 stop:1587 length:399 start_codon:yes stop_codon:yes gene_type:complete
MINFSKKKDYLLKVSSLLIHTAKIDENYTDKEKQIIEKTLIELGANQAELKELLDKADIIEKNSNQILDFTKEIKNLPETEKVKIIESLWKIIYSNENADMYETNLMRRLAGLLYIDDRVMGDIKEKIKKNL